MASEQEIQAVAMQVLGRHMTVTLVRGDLGQPTAVAQFTWCDLMQHAALSGLCANPNVDWKAPDVHERVGNMVSCLVMDLAKRVAVSLIEQDAAVKEAEEAGKVVKLYDAKGGLA